MNISPLALLRDFVVGPTSQKRASFADIVLASGAGSVAIAVLALLGQGLGTTLLLGSFGASSVLLFGYPDSPFSRPRNVILGHLFSALIGLAFTQVLGPTWWSLSLALGTAIGAMMLTRTVHPPAGSNPVIVYLLHPGWGFALFPTLAGAVVLVLLAGACQRLKPR